MSTIDSQEADAAACDFLEMYDRDRAAGRVRSAADYVARFPGFEARIEREFAAMAAAPPPRAARERRVGRYRLIQELGRGGQAVVWLAHDEALDRSVALKLLADGTWRSQARCERLQREASALARLDHPGICTIHEADLSGDPPFLAMRYIAGETLAARLQRARERPEPQSERLLTALPTTTAAIARVLELGERLARALHTAHESGVVHRDVKPQNVMLAADDQPVILDFGIAQTQDEDGATRTRAGEVFGSLAYLPPERLTGRGVADRRGDVYALGVVLFECLTLLRPFLAETLPAMVREIEAGSGRDPVRCNRALPRDVALVLGVALERDPERRYGTALDLAEDLRRLRQHEPIAARPIGPWLRLRRWTRRHPAVAVAIGLMAVALLISAALLARLAAEQQRLAAEQQRLAAWQQVLEAMAAEARPAEALGRVLAAAPHVPANRLNGPLLELLTRSTELLEFTPERLAASNTGTPFFGNDDRELLVPMGDGSIVAVRLADGSTAPRLLAPSGQMLTARAFADSHRLVTSGLDGRVRMFDTATLAEMLLPDALANANADVRRASNTNNWLPRVPVLTRDGARLALVGFDGAIVGGGTAVSAPHWRVERAGCHAEAAFFVRDGSALVVRWRRIGPEQGASEVLVYDAGSGAELATLALGGQETMCGCGDAAGQRLAIAGHDGRIRVLDAATWQCRCEMQAEGEDLRHVYWLGFAPTGDRLVTLGFEGLTLWDPVRGECILRRTSASARPFHVGAWSDDGALFAAVVKDGSVRVYDTADWTELCVAHWERRYPDAIVWNHAGDRFAFQDGRGLHVFALQAPAPEFRPHRDAIVALQFCGDGHRVVTASRDSSAAVVDLAAGRRLAVLPHPAPLRRVRLSADDARAATACEDGHVRVFAVATGELQLDLPAHTGAAVDAQFVAAGSRLLSIGSDGGAHLFDASSGRLLADLAPHDRACLCAAVDEQLGLVATGGADHKVRVHDLDGRLLATLDTVDPSPRPEFDIAGNASALAFDRARGRLLCANRRDTMVVWSLADWGPQWVRPRTDGQEYSMHLASAAGSRFYATAHSGVGDWTFVDADTLTPRDVGRDNFPAAIVSALRFSPDGALLLVASRDDSVSLWDLERGERHLELRGRHGGIRAAEFSRDGRWVATGSQDGTLRAWPVQPLPFARAHHARLTGRP